MKVLTWLLLAVVCSLCSCIYGEADMERKIKMTCDDPHTFTVLADAAYNCSPLFGNNKPESGTDRPAM